MNIYLIRHGEKADVLRNDKNMSLTEKGFLQAKLLGKRMKEIQLDHVYSSDMLRAFQTAQGITQYQNVAITQHKELREINTGVREGKTREEMEQLYPEFMEKWNAHEEDVPFPQGESGRDVFERVMPFLDEVTKSSHKNVAVVSHCGVVRCVVCGILGINFAKRMFVGRPVEYTSVTKLIFENGCWWVDYLNDYKHIEETLKDSVFSWEK